MSFLEICELTGQFLAGIFISLYFCKQYLSKQFKHTDVSKKLKKQNNVDIDVLNYMERIKELVKADRIHVYEFHNGEHYANYRSALKFSCTYEVVRYGANSLRDKCVGIPIACMPSFIKELTTVGKLTCLDIEDIKTEMPSTYGFKNELGVKSFYDIALHNDAGDTIGFIAIQWDTIQSEFTNEAVIQQLGWFIERQLNDLAGIKNGKER